MAQSTASESYPPQDLDTGGGDTLMGVLARRRGTVLVCLVLGLVLGMAYWAFWPKRYTAYGKFTVQRDSIVSQQRGAGSGLQAVLMLGTEAEKARSLPVLGQALDRYDELVATLPAEEARDFTFFDGEEVRRLQHLQNNLSVSAGRETAVIEVSLTTHDAEQSKLLVDAVMASYAEYTSQQKIGRGQAAIAVLEDRYEKTKQELDEVRQRELDLSRTAGVSPMNDGGSLDLQRVEALQKELLSAEMARDQSGQRFDELQELFSDEIARGGLPVENGVSLTVEEEQDVVRELRLMEQRFEQLMQTYLPSHPSVQRLRSQITKLRADLLATNKTRYDAAVRRVERLEGSLDETRTASQTSNRDLLELTNFKLERGRLNNQLEEISQLINQAALEQGSGQLDVEVIEPANVDEDDVTPSLAPSLAGSLALGLIAGVLLALVRESGSPKLPANAKRLSETMALPMLGTLPGVDGATRRRLVLAPVHEPGLDYAAGAIASADAVLASPACQDVGTLLVTAPSVRQGRSTAAATLAVAMAALGRNVVLVDADLESPAVHGIFGRPNETGLADVLRGAADLNDALAETEAPGLMLLSAGEVRGETAAELLNTDEFATTLADLRRTFDVVVLDAAAESDGDAARIAASAADATLLVVRGGLTDRRRAEAARDRLLDVGANVAGLLVNNAPGQPRLAGGGGYDGGAMAASA